jgi:hypothetical protein
VADWDGLENRCTCKRTVSSNLTPSAIPPSALGARCDVKTALLLVIAILPIGLCSPAQAGDPLLREQRSLSVAGVAETWQLVWEEPPRPACGPEDVATAITCPCAGTAYGEAGGLALIRKRGAEEVERMELAPLFGQFDGPPEMDGGAALIRWPMLDGDPARENKGDPTLLSDIKRRAAPTIMRFADYDHDGAETEFLLPIGTLPCTKVQYAAIGVSAKDPHLHALGSAAHPEAMLAMPLPAWHALLVKPGGTTVQLRACGDHGSDQRSELIVSAGKDGIRAHERDFSCPEDGATEKLLQESDW